MSMLNILKEVYCTLISIDFILNVVFSLGLIILTLWFEDFLRKPLLKIETLGGIHFTNDFIITRVQVTNYSKLRFIKANKALNVKAEFEAVPDQFSYSLSEDGSWVEDTESTLRSTLRWPQSDFYKSSISVDIPHGHKQELYVLVHKRDTEGYATYQFNKLIDEYPSLTAVPFKRSLKTGILRVYDEEGNRKEIPLQVIFEKSKSLQMEKIED